MGQINTTGKLDASSLANLLKRYARSSDRSVVIGPGVGLDAAAVKVPAGTLVLASDPVTYATEQLGHYVVCVNANDIYVSGARPRWFLADILLPPGKARLATGILRQIHETCSKQGISLIGGHTEMTPDLPRPMVAGFMVGELLGRKLLSAAAVRSGDAIILTKGPAIEGTALIARERYKELTGKFSAKLINRARRFLHSPGLSVGPEAIIAARCGAHALHDPTEGGLLNGLWEIAQASRVSLHIDTDVIPIYPETEVVCRHFSLDPLGLLGSGALIIACPQRSAAKICRELDEADIPACKIGQARKARPVVHFKDGRTVSKSVADEILKVFE